MRSCIVLIRQRERDTWGFLSRAFAPFVEPMPTACCYKRCTHVHNEALIACVLPIFKRTPVVLQLPFGQAVDLVLCMTATGTGNPHHRVGFLSLIDPFLACFYIHTLKPSSSYCLSTCLYYGRYVFKTFCLFCLSTAALWARVMRVTATLCTMVASSAAGTAIMDADCAVASAAVQQ